MFLTLPTTPHIKRELNTRKAKFSVFFVENTGVEYKTNTASYWDGGSRDIYIARELATGRIKHPPTGSYPRFIAEYTLQPGWVLINSGTSMGKPSTIFITVYRNDIPALNNWLQTAIE